MVLIAPDGALHLSEMLFLRHGQSSPSSLRRSETHAVQLTPYKRSAVWWRTTTSAKPRTSSSTTSPSGDCSVRNHRHASPWPTPASTATPPPPASGWWTAPCRWRRWWGCRDVASLRDAEEEHGIVGMRGPHLCIPSLVLSPHCAASPLVWC